MSRELAAKDRTVLFETIGTPDVVFDALSHGRRRTILAVLRERGAPVARNALVEDIATREREDTGTVLTTLVHVHLPKLEDAGLVRCGPDDEIGLPEDSLVRSQGFGDLLEAAAAFESDVSLFADRRRRELLAELIDRGEPMGVEELALVLRANASGTPEEADAGCVAGADEVRVSLHHVHLPKLDAAGVVDYDHERGTVTYRGLPSFYESWLATGNVDRLP
ncbi:MAG: hypothetical protein ABEJ28_07110 [Salinigranum sp.]